MVVSHKRSHGCLFMVQLVSFEFQVSHQVGWFRDVLEVGARKLQMFALVVGPSKAT
jgi:hypothetical protein